MGSITLKRYFKYTVKKRENGTEYYADIKWKTILDLRYKFIKREFGKTEDECRENAEKFVSNYSQCVWLDDYFSDRTADLICFLKSLVPWHIDGIPGRTWKKARKYFKKLPVKFEFVKEPVIYAGYGYDRVLKPYNIVFLKIQDVQWKWKYRWIRFEESPEISLTFFRKWTLRWHWSIGVADILYWEDLLEYLYDNRNPDDIGLKRLYSSYDESDIITIDNWIQNIPKK